MHPNLNTNYAIPTPSASDKQPTTVHELTERNIALIAALEASEKSKRTLSDRMVDRITSFCGNLSFVWVHAMIFTAWIALNAYHVFAFDPYPFNLLSMAVSAEAIFLTTFVLISANRERRMSERRAHLDLQINLLSEQENTAIISMLVTIQEKLGITKNDRETELMMETTEPSNLVQQIEDIIESPDESPIE